MYVLNSYAQTTNYAKDQSPELLRKRGAEYKSEKKYDSAEISFIDALSRFEHNKDSDGMAKTFHNLALLYQMMNKNEDALSSFLSAAGLYEALKRYKDLSNCYLLIGRFHFFQKNYDKALEYFTMAKDVLPEPIESVSLAIIYSGLGSIYSNKNYSDYNLEQAQSQFLSALALFQDVRDSANIAKSYHNLGLIYEESEKYQQAINYYNKSLTIKESLGDQAGILVTHLNLGNVHKANREFIISLDYYEKGKALAKVINDRLNYLHLLSNIVDVKIELGYANEAAKLFEEYRILRDSIYNDEQSKHLAELQTQYETEKKDREIALQKKESVRQSQQNQLLTFLLVIISLLAISTFWFFGQRQKAMKILGLKEEELHQQQINKLQKEQVIKSLNAMMSGQEQERQRIASDLHDRIGTKLSAIKLYSESGNNAERMDHLLNETIQETREIAHNLSSGILSKFGLVAALNDLIKTLNDSNKISAHLSTTQLKSKLDPDIESNVYSIAQELISNTLKHAKADNIFLQITEDENQTFTMIYEDNGVGFDPDKIKGDGIGMNNLKARAARINAELTIDSTPDNGQTTIIAFKIN